MARIESGTYPIVPETFRFADAVDTSLSMVSCQAKAKGVSLERKLADAPGDLFADRAVKGVAARREGGAPCIWAMWTGIARGCNSCCTRQPLTAARMHGCRWRAG